MKNLQKEENEEQVLPFENSANGISEFIVLSTSPAATNNYNDDNNDGSTQ